MQWYSGAVTQCAVGTEVLLDTRFIDADIKLATGLVEPHFMAGQRAYIYTIGLGL